jgi:hypothetical protein
MHKLNFIIYLFNYLCCALKVCLKTKIRYNGCSCMLFENSPLIIHIFPHEEVQS